MVQNLNCPKNHISSGKKILRVLSPTFQIWDKKVLLDFLLSHYIFGFFNEKYLQNRQMTHFKLKNPNSEWTLFFKTFQNTYYNIFKK